MAERRATNILIVEDEIILALNMQDHLEGLGFRTSDIAISGDQALKSIAENRPDLVLMDIGLKGEIDGVEAARQIRASMNIPVIFMTAYSDEETLQRSRIAEPSGYLVKPIRLHDLKNAIQMALKQ